MRTETRKALDTDEEKDERPLDLEVVRDVGGRPLFLTARRFIRICKWIEQGKAVTAACRLELVTYQGFRKHVKRSPAYQRRLKQAEEIRFQRRHEEAVESVLKAGEKSWMAHAWYLERVLPHLYALRNVNRSEGGTDQPIGDQVSEEQLRRYAALMDEFKRENEKAVVVAPALPDSGSAAA